jgi:two-component system CheB/CheR fusion protein
MVQALERKLQPRSKEEAAQAGRISEHVRDAIRQAKALSRGLSPVGVEANGLMSALQELALNIRDIFRANVSFHARCPVLISDNAAATHLFRIAQEAISNAVKHGKALNVELEIDQKPNEILLSIKDDGAGFSPGQDRGGMGLRIMAYRAEMIGGKLTVQSSEGRGTKVVCTVPVPG